MLLLRQVLEIVRHCPVGRQSLLFSATMVSKVEELINLSLKKPVRVSADVVYDMTSRLTQEFVRIRPVSYRTLAVPSSSRITLLPCVRCALLVFLLACIALLYFACV